MVRVKAEPFINCSSSSDECHRWWFYFVGFFQDRKAVEKRKEENKAKEKQQEELSKQKQIEKVNFNTWTSLGSYWSVIKPVHHSSWVLFRTWAGVHVIINRTPLERSINTVPGPEFLCPECVPCVWCRTWRSKAVLSPPPLVPPPPPPHLTDRSCCSPTANQMTATPQTTPRNKSPTLDEPERLPRRRGAGGEKNRLILCKRHYFLYDA